MPAPLFPCSSAGIPRPSWNPSFSELFFRPIFETFLNRFLTYLGPHFRSFWLVFNVIVAAVFKHRFGIDFSTILMSFSDPRMSQNHVFTADVSQKLRFCRFQEKHVFFIDLLLILDAFLAHVDHHFLTFSVSFFESFFD